MHEGWLKYVFYLFKKFYCVNMNNCFHFFLVCLLSIDSGKTVRFIKKSFRKKTILNSICSSSMHFFFGPDMAKMCIMNPISYLNKKGIQSIIWSWIVIYPIWVILYHVSDSTHIEMFLIYFSRYFLVLFLKHSSLYTCVYICINLLNIFFLNLN